MPRYYDSNIPMEGRNFSELLGLTLSNISMSEDKDRIVLRTADGRVFWMFHEQDCCECVQVEDVIGDIEDVLDAPLLLAEEVTNSGHDEERDSYTWTFYKMSTIKGNVTLRWLGSSNGYYSESVTLVEVF